MVLSGDSCTKILWIPGPRLRGDKLNGNDQLGMDPLTTQIIRFRYGH